MVSDWFGCVLVISFYVAKVFSESVAWSSSCFTNAQFFAISASYAVDDIGGGAPEVISDLNGSLQVGADIRREIVNNLLESRKIIQFQ